MINKIIQSPIIIPLINTYTKLALTNNATLDICFQSPDH